MGKQKAPAPNNNNNSNKSFFDRATDILLSEVLAWFKSTVHAELPLALDSLRGVIEKTVESVFADTNKTELPPITGSMETFLEGQKSGELRKELAMIAGMGKIGLSKEQIDQVLEYAKHAWDPVSKKKEP